MPADELVAQLRGVGGAVFSPSTVKTIKAIWAERGSGAAADAAIARTLSIGKVCAFAAATAVPHQLQLVDFQWKVGVAAQSSACRALNHPFVGVQLRVADSAGNETVKGFELSIAEFKVCG